MYASERTVDALADIRRIIEATVLQPLQEGAYPEVRLTIDRLRLWRESIKEERRIVAAVRRKAQQAMDCGGDDFGVAREILNILDGKES